MNYPSSIANFLKTECAETGYGFWESEWGNFYGVGYSAPHVFVDDVNKYLREVDPDLKPEDLYLPEDARKVWGQVLDTPDDHDEFAIQTDKVTERSPHAFQLYILVV
jgi:hypothetical protein